VINLVAGFGRCGSSLVMQMIHSVGGPTAGSYPMFETGNRNICVPDGFSVKILEPLVIGIPKGEYRTVWMDRDATEQAKSEVKFLRSMGASIDDHYVDLIAGLHRKERFDARERLSKYGEIMTISFERLLTQREEVQRLAAFLNLDDVDTMLAQIIPRPTECQADLNIEMRLAESGSKS